MDSRWTETAAWRPVLQRGREAAETLARNMQAAEQREQPNRASRKPPARQVKRRRRKEKQDVNREA